jgi:hypothetical protein
MTVQALLNTRLHLFVHGNYFLFGTPIIATLIATKDTEPTIAMFPPTE